MKYRINWIFKNLHLIISLIIVVPTAIIYGVYPFSLISQYLDIQVDTNDISNLLRAIMFLYLGFSFIWFLGTFKTEYWKLATQLNILFMLPLATGRVLSMIIDGLPSDGYIFAVIAELVLGIYSIYQLKKYRM